jgi:hypothetical protein
VLSAPLRSTPLYSTRLFAPLPEIRTLLPSAPCFGLCVGAGGCEAVGLDWIGLDWIGLDWIGLDWIGLDWIGLDWIGLSTFIRYMAGLQFEPIGMYCSILYTSGGFDAV